MNLAILDTSINKAPKSNVIVDLGLACLSLMISEYLEGFVKHSNLAISLDQNSNLDGHIVGALVVFSQIKSVVMTLNLHVLKHIRDVRMLLSQFMNLNGLLSHAVSDTKVHEGVKNYHVNVVRSSAFSSQQMSQVATNLRQVLLGCLDLGWILQIDQLAMSQNFESTKKLRHCKVVWMNSFLLLDVLKNVLKTLDEILNLLEEALLVELFDNILLLLESCHGFVASKVCTEGVDQG